MLPRVNSALLKNLKPIADSNHDSVETLFFPKSEKKDPQHKPQSKKEGKAPPHLKLVSSQESSPAAPVQPEQASKENLLFEELANSLQENRHPNGVGVKIYTDSVKRLKRAGSFKKGIIFDERVE